MARGYARGTYPLTPFLRGRGNGERFCEGLREGGLGFYGVTHSPKAIKTTLAISHQRSFTPLSSQERGRGIGPAGKG